MKSYEIQPTDENILKTLLEDTIGRDKDIRYFIQTLDKLEGHWSISLDSQWGSGKTFFVKQTKLVLEAFNDNIKKDIEPTDVADIKKTFKNDLGITQSFLPIYYDAWANDNDEDPILSLIYQITQDIEIYYDIKDLPVFADVGINICSMITGRDYKALFNSIKSTDPLGKIKKEKDLQEEINEFFNRLLEERAERLVIFVDELDRCKPTYAVHFLERIKHYFANDNIIFVFSINSMELQKTIKKFYGHDFEAYKYLDRFFNMKLRLPEADMRLVLNSIGVKDTSRYWYDIITNAFIECYSLDIRMTTKYLQLQESCCYDLLHGKSRNMYYGDGFFELCSVFVPIIIGLFVSNISLYDEFIKGRNVNPLIDVLSATDRIDYYYHTLLGFDKTTDFEVIKSNLTKLYINVMNYKEEEPYSEIRIGKIAIDRETKKSLFAQTKVISEGSDLLKGKQ